MIGYELRFCNYCQHSIVVGQRWVREKIYDPRSTGQDAAYRHFHAEQFEGQEVSCWERYLMQREMARTAVTGGNASTVRAVSLVA
jgi:hypothetical protein